VELVTGYQAKGPADQKEFKRRLAEIEDMVDDKQEALFKAEGQAVRL